MARTFTAASAHRITLSLGAGASLSGAVSLTGIVKRASDAGAQRTVISAGPSTGQCWMMYLTGANEMALWNGSNACVGAVSTTLLTADGWAFVAWTKGAGTVVPRVHRYVYATNTWTHGAGGQAMADKTPATNTFLGSENGSSGSPWDGDIAAVGAYAANLTDAQIESMAFDLNAWWAVQPNGLWLLDQAAITQLVEDRTGGGANQTSITGTTVSTNAVPVFSYGAPSLTGFGFPAAAATTSLPISPNSRRYAHLWRKAS